MSRTFQQTRFPPDFLQAGFFRDLGLPATNDALEWQGYRLPGLVDIHVHGAMGWDFSYGNVERITKMLDDLVPTGLTGVVATLITCSEEQRVQALADIRTVAELRRGPPQILGIYLEGPFLSPKRRGSHPAELLMEPSLESLRFWQEVSGDRIKLVTLAPELPGALSFIAGAREMGIRVAIGHTDADHATTNAALQAGADHVTHLYNAMRPFSHRDPTAVSAILSNRTATVELIGDLIHVAPEIVGMTYSLIGPQRVALISDGVCPMGLPDGLYDAYEQKLELKEGRCGFAGGHLFGGGMSLLQALPRLHEQVGIPLRALSTSMSATPIRALGLDLQSADVVVDQQFRWLATRFNEYWYWAADKVS